MTDQEVIRQVLTGDTNVYGHLVRSYSKMCFSVAFRVCGDSEEAQDIVQESFINAYEHLKEFKGESKFSTWLYRIVLNKALAVKNKQQFFEEVDNYSKEEDDYDIELDLKQAVDIKIALSSLSKNERLMVELFYLQEQSIKEIASITGLSESNVKVILHRSRKKMQEAVFNKGKFAQE